MPKVPLGLRLERELIDAIDAARGDVSRAKWIERALGAALRDPGQGQPVASGLAQATGSTPELASSAPRRAPVSNSARVADFMRGPR